MGKSYEVNQIYHTVLSEITSSEQSWKEFLTSAGNIYRYDFSNACLIYAQRPGATMLVDYDNWQRAGRYVKRYSKGIVIFPTDLLGNKITHVFDIEDTGGRYVPWTWKISEKNRAGLAERLGLKEKDEKAMKNFTRTYVCDILKEEYQEQQANLKTLANETQEPEASGLEQFLVDSSYYMVSSRCGFDLSDDQLCLERIVRYRREAVSSRMGIIISEVSERVLRSIARNIKTLEQEREIKYGSNGIQVQGKGRAAVSRHQDAEAGKSDGHREVWNDGTQLSEGNRYEQVQLPFTDRNAGRENAGSRRNGLAGNQPIYGGIFAAPTPLQSRGRIGNEQAEAGGNHHGGRERTERNRLSAKIDKELKEIEEGTTEREAVEASLLHVLPSYEPIEIPQELAIEVIQKGTGFHNAKKRIYEFFIGNPDCQQRIKYLKKEYGIGSVNEYKTEIGILNYNTLKSQGIQIQWKDKNSNKEGYFNWREVEAEISMLILSGEYYQPVKEIQNQNGKEKAEEFQAVTSDEVPEPAEMTIEIEADSPVLSEYDIPDDLPVTSHKNDAPKAGEFMEAMDCYFTESPTFQPFQSQIQDIFKLELGKKRKAQFLRAFLESKRVPDSYVNKVAGLLQFMTMDNGVEVSYVNHEKLRQKEFITDEALTDMLQFYIDNDIYMDKKDYLRSTQEEDYELRKQQEPFKEYYEEAAAISKKAVESKAGDFFYPSDWQLPTGGAKTRYKANIAAIKILKQIEGENRSATRDEQTVLSYYVGWGGIANAFNQKDSSWTNEYEQLKALLEEAEYEAARASVNNAFYTSPEITGAIYKALHNFGFRKGNMLEPAVAIGNMYSALPENMRNSNLYGVEIDSISGRIAKQLHPHAKIQIKGYEQTEFAKDFFDVAIGNVPFGDYKLYDPIYNKHNFLIHDYFFAKTLDNVRPGGLMCLITSKGTLDKANNRVRKYIAKRAELIGAIRLPNTAFKGNAGTDVTSDILFLQKRERMEVVEPEWIHLGYTPEGIPVNQYYVEHPEMMLGKMVYDTRMFGAASQYTTLINDSEAFHLQEKLELAVERLNAQFHEVDIEEQKQMDDIIPADPAVRNYTYTLIEDRLYYRENAAMRLKEVSENARSRIRGMHQIRQITRQLIGIQMEGCSEELLKSCQKELNTAYDSFVKQYGYLSSQSNSRAFRDDNDYPLLCSLELVDEDKNVTKAAMFHKQTIAPKIIIDHVDTAMEALNVCLGEHGKVHLPYMLAIYDRTAEQLVSELKGQIFLDPLEYQAENFYAGWKAADEYLSGNVREKLTIAQSFAKTNPDVFGINVEVLTTVQPPDLNASEIDVRLGTTWIEPEDYEKFLYDLLNTKRYARLDRMASYPTKSIEVILNTYNMNWYIQNKYMDNSSVAATEMYGTKRMDAYNIIEECLNLRTITIKDRIEEGDSVRYVLNKKETMLARDKANLVKEEFKSWIFKDVERRQKYVKFYNENFNNTRLRQYDGSHMLFPGMNPEIQLRTHQKNAIARVIQGGNTLLAHCVGAGKSFEMIAACMEQKRLGLIQKAMIVVPNHLTDQMAGEFLRLYPSANVLVTTKRDFAKEKRQQFVSRIATGEYDAVIIGHSQFERIPISIERRERMVEEQIDNLVYAISDAKLKQGENWTVKQMESAKKKLEVQLKELGNAHTKDAVINFEELGIDCLMVDEAHGYKNLAIFSKINNVGGISNVGAKKATDMLLKTQYINEINGGRGVIFATGTPISNTMCELYVMQNYLQQDVLKRKGIHHFDAWASNFGEVVTSLELAPEGTGYRFKSRFAKFTNLPELMTMFKEVADVQLSDMLDLKIPKLKDGSYKVMESRASDYVEEVMNEFVERAEEIRGGIDPSIDNMLKITNEARLLGTDPRLLDVNAPMGEETKLSQVAASVYEEYVNSKEVKGTQIVFSDIGTPGTGKKFNVYDHLKQILVEKGIPEKEICFIHDATTDAKRDEMFADMRSGNKRIIIGSTPKMGTGTNIQKRLVALHHVDVPWRPADIEQREGRIIRQGNDNKEVNIYRYVTKGTFDAYSWGLVENKQRFISQIMTRKSVARNCEDVDDAVLSYAEMKAVATGNPLIREKMQLENEVSQLKMLKANYESQRYTMQDNYLIKYPQYIKAAKQKVNCIKEDISRRDEMFLKTPEFEIQVDQRVYTEREDAGVAILAMLPKIESKVTTAIGCYKGFPVQVEKHFLGESYFILKGNASYKTEIGTSTTGNIIRIENILHGLEKNIEKYEQKLESYQSDMEQSKREYEKPFQHEFDLKLKSKRLGELNIELDIGKEEAPQMEQKIDEEPVFKAAAR